MIRTFFANLWAAFGPAAPRRYITLYQASGNPLRYIKRYWSTQDFTKLSLGTSPWSLPTVAVGLGMICQLGLGIALLYVGVDTNNLKMLYSGAVLTVSYPLVWAHVIFLAGILSWLARPKKLGKSILSVLLERQVSQLRSKHSFTVVAVAGSVGKTSTKLAIAHVLGMQKRVLFQAGNYNDRLTVPLIFFNEQEPSIFNVVAWAKLLMRNARQLKRPYPYDVVVVELGTDGPGQMSAFAYLQPEVGVLTAVAPEHMEYFRNLDAVAREELTLSEYSKQLLVNTDAVDQSYLAGRNYQAYGKQGAFALRSVRSHGFTGQKLTLALTDGHTVSADVPLVGIPGASTALAAAAVARLLELDDDAIKTGLESLPATPGRMQILAGIDQSVLIDDTYNASPVAVMAGLDALYAAKTPQRIAILGSMNELGSSSKAAHRQVGAYCNPKKLTHVVTIGREAKEYLAPAAKKAGCTVKSYLSPYEAGEFVKTVLTKKAVVLVKGSQNGVFAEEALKALLADPEDAHKLVRQTPYWRRIKRSQFGD